MHQRKRLLYVILILLLPIVLIACSTEGKDSEDVIETPEEDEPAKVKDKEDQDQEEDEEENKEEDKSVAKVIDEDIFLEGKVMLEADEIIVQGHTNLVEDTVLRVNLVYNQFVDLRTSVYSNHVVEGEVDHQGEFTIHYEIKDNFYEWATGQYVELSIEVIDRPQPDKVLDIYGHDGERLTGPLIYQYERRDDLKQKLYVPVYMLIDEEKTEYVIETPDREPLPDDYGQTDIWIDAEVADNDHRYLYVQGKTNLLEGTKFLAEYFSDDEVSYAQGVRRNKTYIEPDGTFLLRIDYKSITDDGFIKITSTPSYSHRTANKTLETYGETFEKLSGDVVIEGDEGKEIELILQAKGLDLDAPDTASVTEEDGEVKIQVPDDVLFDFDKSDLKDAATKTLDEVITLLEDLESNHNIEINGHTDNQGAADYNLNLSEERAATVEEYLINHGHLDHLNIVTKGYGKTQPIASNEDKSGRKQNRRVEIVIYDYVDIE
ncbi:MAG TPA: OmpA family protein [Virgibacillus sp.]|nr:OmpA family protein [Virgibacillus sp.]